MQTSKHYLAYQCDTDEVKNKSVELPLEATEYEKAFKEARDLWEEIKNGKDPREHNHHGQHLVSRP